MNSVTILCLHKVSDKHTPSWPSMPIKTFSKLLKYINKHYEVVSPKNINSTTTKKKLILTFDDGFEDFYKNALPLLKTTNTPAVLNVVYNSITSDFEIWTQRLNDVLDAYAKKEKPIDTVQWGTFPINIQSAEKVALTIFKKLLHLDLDQRFSILKEIESKAPQGIQKTKMMNVSQLKECVQNGIEIGSHSLSHINLKDESLSEKILQHEIIGSKNKLEQLLEIQIPHFAFPNGEYDERALKIATEAKYQHLFLVNNNIAHWNTSDNPVILDRILIYSNKHWKNIIRVKNYHNRIKKW
jgi:peptidoglycan/xylan/chitin deacetylase (PgdA/CDA1 family)